MSRLATSSCDAEECFKPVPKEGKNKFKDVVISGISCRLPESDNMAEFRDNLMNGVDMVTENDRRWKQGMYGLPKGNGKLKDLSKFDAEFFGVSPKQAAQMDPQVRLLLEVAYEALADAGQCPETIKGSNIGVFIGAESSESHEAWTADPETVSGYTMTGCSKTFLANRLSYYFNFKGPSLVLDTACSSSCMALHYALQSIRSGKCDAALAGGSNLCLKPVTSVQFKNLGMLSPEGRCKSFDAHADGYGRSDGVVMVYLQKSVDARRIYCHVVNTGTNHNGYTQQGITYPSREMQRQLLEQTYSEVGVKPSNVSYIEMHGTGTQAGDIEETNVIFDFFCQQREEPLLVGSVKSNMGHCETASGMASLAKVIISMEEGIIPGNLHFRQPNPHITALLNDNLKVVDRNIVWDGGYVGLNNFGFGGSNGHVILKSPDIENVSTNANVQQKLLCYTSRTEDGVKHVLQQARFLPIKDHFLALICESVKLPPMVQTYRGFTIVNGSSSTDNIILHESYRGKRPVWYVFAGMGCQWPKMGRQMMSLHTFRSSILKCEQAVDPYGLKLTEILMSGNESTYGDIVNAFVAITAIQVALVDLLHSVGIKPDGLIGHSVGELGCAYADGCFSAEETVLVAYWRGICIKKANIPPGKMAAVGLTWEEASKRCPSNVVPACHNGADSVTISGPKMAVEEFASELREQNIFAKEVNSAEIPFHSYFMKAAEISLYEMFRKIIKVSHERSPKWKSTSVKQTDRDSHLAKYSSPEYHVNNVLSPVLFHDALQEIPENAVVIEIAPHGLLQAILKRSLSRGDCYITSLMQRSSSDNVEFCLTTLGNLYLNGVTVTPQALLTPISFPTPRGTPMLSPLISWKHDHNWQVPSPDMFVKSPSANTEHCYSYVIDVHTDAQYHYLTGHKIDGRMLFPAAGYLMLSWKSYARSKGKSFDELPVTFENVRFQRATIIPKSGPLVLVVTLLPKTGSFEIAEGDDTAVSGRILPLTQFKPPVLSTGVKTTSEIMLSSADVYKELRLRGYEYEDLFKGIAQMDLNGISGQLCWSNNFVAFMDAVLQVMLFHRRDQGILLPTSIKSVDIDPLVQLAQGQQVGVYIKGQRCISGGVMVTGLMPDRVPFRKQEQQPRVEVCKLFLHGKALKILEDAFHQHYVTINLQLAIQLVDYITENCADVSMNTLRHIPALKNEANASRQCTDVSEGDYRDDTFVLMKAFRSALDEGISNETKSDEWLERYTPTFKKAIISDGVFSSISKPKCLAPCIDIVVENVVDKLKIVELAAPNMKDFIEQTLDGHVNLQYSYDVLDTGFVLESNAPFPFKTANPNLVVVDNVFHRQPDLKTCLQNIVHSLGDGDFLIVKEVTRNYLLQFLTNDMRIDEEVRDGDLRTHGFYYTVETLQEMFTQVGLVNIYEIHDHFLYSLFLLRKRNTGNEKEARIVDVSSLGCEWVEDVKRSITELNTEAKSDANLWLYADTKCSGVLGMINCVKLEPGGHRIRSVLNNRQPSDVKMKDVVDGLLEKDLVFNVLNDNGVGSYRSVPCRQEHVFGNSSGYYYVDVQTYGDLSSISWFQTSLNNFKDNAENEPCKVEFASLNFRDVMLATAKLSPDAIPGNNANKCLLGMEFSGTDSKGNRVMGIVPAKALATHVDVKNDFLWNVPNEWSLTDAASIPVAYSTAYYALIVRGHLKHGEKILIHSGSGGVGQAAIRIALFYDCEVFTTVGTDEKRTFLLATFAKLKSENMFSSRDTAFEDGIMDATSGYGVDIVLNSLSEEKLKASLNVLGLHGRFLEIGKFDLFKDTYLGMATFLKNSSFHGIVLDSLFQNGNNEWQEVSRLIKDGIKNGVIEPLKTTVYQSHNVEEAFRYMAKGNHIGKILIEVGAQFLTDKVSAFPRFVCSSKKSYVIIGGLGGFGLELAQWLTSRDAKSIILTTRSGVRTAYQTRKIQTLKELGVEVVVCKKNAGNMKEAEEIINECSLPCGGIFNTAMILDDGLIENQTAERFRRVIEPKLVAAINLDTITRATCIDSCDYFVMFSSVVSGRGNAGQSNYGFANSGMERICEQRKRDGLHGLAIQWGVVKDVGVVFERFGHNHKGISGSVPQSLRSCFATLDIFLTQCEPVVSSVLQETKHEEGSEESSDDRNVLMRAICHILGIRDSFKVNNSAPLESLGLDSLMTVEIIQTVERITDVRLKAAEVRQLTFETIQNLEKEKFVSDIDYKTAPENNRTLLPFDDVLIPKELIVALNKNRNDTCPLYIVHTIEGTVNYVRQFASLIQRPVFGIQCTSDVPLASVTDMAKYYLQAVLDHNSFNSFHLAGYSYGGMVSLEIGYQIGQTEFNSKLLSLIMLDGTHVSIPLGIRMYQQKLDMTIDTFSLARLGNQLLEDDPEELWHELNKLPSYAKRAELILSKIRLKKPDVTERDFIDTADAYCRRQLIALDYTFPGILDKRVVLISSKDWQVERKNLGSDQGLEKIVKGPVKVYTVPGRHVTLLEGRSGQQVAHYINNELSSYPKCT